MDAKGAVCNDSASVRDDNESIEKETDSDADEEEDEDVLTENQGNAKSPSSHDVQNVGAGATEV
ncbi:hypothetical protein U1Q18_006666 [Sarracenia purpurea var. burkii]